MFVRKMLCGCTAHNLHDSIDEICGDRFQLSRVKALVRFFLFLIALTPDCALAYDLALIEAAEINQNTGQWVILDARPKPDWLAGHIPGAHSFSWEDYTRTDEKGRAYRLDPPGKLSTALGQMGIDENTPVAVYGDADRSLGGEGWIAWVLSWLGHEGHLRVIAGGIQAWKDQGYPLTTGPERSTRPVSAFRVRLRPEINVETRELESKDRPFVLIDCRTNLEWMMGHIPGAVHIPWTEFRTGREYRPLDQAGLRRLLKSHGVDPEKPIVYYCTGGVRSGYAWMEHQLDGLSSARNYLGGIEDWRTR
jgi:thiosulfate/3-mercaptopyruvate sulfurtransferase